MKKFILLLPFLFWMFLVVGEIGLFALHLRPMYFRAWEYVMNDGLDGYYVPFKPYMTYDGQVSGDLTEMFNFTPRKRDIDHQFFHVDEYGYRNSIGLLNKPVEAVTIGTSWVGGAHETQKNLVSSLLTDTYKIPTYNYATQPLQHFWEDARFKTHPPKYIIIIGSEMEFFQNHFIETLQNTTITHEIKKWNSQQEWAAINDHLPLDYPSLASYMKHYSVVKYGLRWFYLTITNTLFTREQLANFYGDSQKYDAKNDILYFDQFDTTKNGPFKNNVQPTLNTLQETEKILKTRGITMIVAVVPNKASMHSTQFSKISTDKKVLHTFEQEMDKNKINHINLLDDLSSYVTNDDHLVYFRDDSHWDAYVNKIIAKKLAAKIHEIEQK